MNQSGKIYSLPNSERKFNTIDNSIEKELKNDRYYKDKNLFSPEIKNDCLFGNNLLNGKLFIPEGINIEKMSNLLSNVQSNCYWKENYSNTDLNYTNKKKFDFENRNTIQNSYNPELDKKNIVSFNENNHEDSKEINISILNYTNENNGNADTTDISMEEANSPSILSSGLFKNLSGKESPSFSFDLDPCKRDIGQYWSQSPTFASLSPPIWVNQSLHTPKIRSQLTQYTSSIEKDIETCTQFYEEQKCEGVQDSISYKNDGLILENKYDTQNNEPDTPSLEDIYKKIHIEEQRGINAGSAINILKEKINIQNGEVRKVPRPVLKKPKKKALIRKKSNRNSKNNDSFSSPISDLDLPFLKELPENEFLFLMKPARKGNDHYVTNTPRDLYSQPYKYDIRISFPSTFRDSCEPSLQICVEKTRQFVGRNHKNEKTLILEKFSRRDFKDKTVCNYRIVFNVCSFHVSKSNFTLHIFFLPIGKDDEKTDFSKMEPIWKSLPFELFARKVNPIDWPSQKEIMGRYKSFLEEKDQKLSSKNESTFLNKKPFIPRPLIPLKTTADPALLTQVVNSAIQKRTQFNGIDNGLCFEIREGVGSLALEDKKSKGLVNLSELKRNKRKRNLQVNTQVSKRQKTSMNEKNDIFKNDSND